MFGFLPDTGVVFFDIEFQCFNESIFQCWIYWIKLSWNPILFPRFLFCFISGKHFFCYFFTYIFPYTFWFLFIRSTNCLHNELHVVCEMDMERDSPLLVRIYSNVVYVESNLPRILLFFRFILCFISGKCFCCFLKCIFLLCLFEFSFSEVPIALILDCLWLLAMSISFSLSV